MSQENEDRILVLAPIGRDAELTAGALQKAGMISKPCPALQDLCACIEEGAAVVIVGEEALNPAAVESISKVLGRQPQWSDLPFIILTTGGRSTELTARHSNLIEQLGHITLLERPLRIVTLVTAVRAGLRSRARQYELRDRVEALRASELRFRSAFEHAAVGIAMLCPQGRYLDVNAALADITGYTREELQSTSFAAITHPDDLVESQRLHDLLVSGEVPFVTHEKRYVRKTGDAVWVRVSTSVVRGEDGRAIYTISLVEEITDRRQAEEALAAQATELARSNADLQQFAWVTSHDLREPIRTLVAFSQLLLQRYGGRFDEEADQALEFIGSSAKRMESLVRDLLAYSHVVNAEARPHSRVSLSTAIDWAMSNLQVSLAGSQCVVERGPLPDVLAEEVLVVQLFQNLLANAIKYRSEDPLVVRVTATKHDGEVIVSVKDNGIGIEPRYSERIFGLFKRLHGSDIQGTGLGLTICRKIVERHGGKIWVESQPGQGADFLFTLPAAD
jgi:PAS domain S-box-containing protein